MRLKTIKLAGFKSFVDPTNINLISNLTGVVGPNGCGKSNVIDAVRWVMGESSAKNLRGEALTDVIFSGSATRKPVGQATVELMFDNVEGKLGGEYASYSEIAIKRQVTREGQSNYYLNGQRCRRKDITDIFLGTGLGPRSYAIIEQGMITRVILAKPEELRIFIEEAAGISKYKERRRETENRIQHTQDNLARLNDLRDELDKQLRHLERQSQTAARYQEFKTQEKTLSAQLATLAWQRLDREIVHYEQQIRETLVQLSEQQANVQQYKTANEKQRLMQSQANETLNEVQKRYYSLGAEISKIEQALVHQEERREQLKVDKSEAQEALHMANTLLEKDRHLLTELSEKITHAEPGYASAQEAVQMAQAVVESAEMQLEEWREQVAMHSQATLGPTRIAEAEKAKIAHLERQIQQIQERSKRLEAECQGLVQDDPIEAEALAQKREALSLQQEECIAQLEQVRAKKQACQAEIEAVRSELKQCEQVHHQTQGTLSALEALQASALGQNVESRKAWLAASGLGSSKAVAQLIQVQAGWEMAAEMVLEGFVEALGVSTRDMNDILTKADLLAQEGLGLLEWGGAHTVESDSRCLIHYVQSPVSLPVVIQRLLQKIYVAQDVATAKALLSTLSVGESVVTPEGVWMGEGWIRIKKRPVGSSESGSLLAREEKIKQLVLAHERQEAAIDVLQQTLQEKQDALAQWEAFQETQQQEKNHLSQTIVTLEGQSRIVQNRIEQVQKRREAIQRELGECQVILQDCQQEVNQSRTKLHEVLEKMMIHTQEQEALTQQKAPLHENVHISRMQAKAATEKVNTLALEIQTFRTQVVALRTNVERFETQIESATLKLSTVADALTRIDEPVGELKMDLERRLEERLLIEEELSSARNEVASIDNVMRELEKKIELGEREIDRGREKSEQAKLQWQALCVHRENVLEKLKVLEVVLEEVSKTLPEGANEPEWQERLQDVEQKIQRLGPINLAAIEEHEAALQRKEYLDSQLADLTEALATLDNAIRKIDKETRAKFKETFDRVNSGFEKLFPKLFGGGQASLSMTGDDLLDTGITLMARPPGKKNSTIHQLSGGEKALTAVALVFAIFELNPAPFCMLDEVDAPLDDSNVGRFCGLVKEMSSAVQFIYVSHNKLAIEMAQQLQGVTMREPGVSRLVTVDIEEARSLVEA